MEGKVKIIKPFAGFQENFVRSNVDVCFGGGQLSGGKQCPDYQPVMTPNGWVKHGDLKVGDYVCTPFNGVAEIRGVYPQGVKQCYELTFSDGRKCEAGLEHLWEVRTYKQIRNYRKHGGNTHFYVWTTKEVMRYMEEVGDLYIPISHAIEFKEKEYIIPPYVMGVLLGDGCLTDKTWHNPTHIRISNTESDIIDKVYRMVDGSKFYVNPSNCTKSIFTPLASEYHKYIKSVGLNTYSYNKYIPEEYLFGSIEQRKQLLFGLMDTDGCIEDTNSYSFSTTSERLKDDFIHLCRSLGYITTLGIDKRSDKYTSGVAYDIRIHTDDIIFSSEKQMRRYHEQYDKYIKDRNYGRGNDHIKIVSIKPTKKTPCTCIYVDDVDHLYITKDFVVTHNTFGAIMSIAEPSLDPNFRACFLRNNLGDLKSGGGIIDEFREVYSKGINIIESGERPHIDFPSGASVDITHIADQSRSVLEKRFKGRQYDLIYFDEMTGFEWSTFTFLFSRNRGTAKWTGKVRATTNPKRSHWLRVFLDWYIGVDGEVIEEREGVVRYFYIAGEDVKSVVWGDSKEEVYSKAKIQIDRFLKKFNGKKGNATYKDVIKSFTFYLGRTSDNKAMGNKYASSVAAMGGRQAEENSGNWNVDPDEGDLRAIPQVSAAQIFTNDPQINGDKWITCDLADTGTDNLVALAWDGLHIFDCMTLSHSTPRMNAERLEMFAASHDISNGRIIYDAVRGTYINDYIPEAVQFMSYRHPIGLYGRMAMKLKDECYMRLCEMIKRGMFSIDESVAERIYEHQRITENITFQNEFLEECSVVAFKDAMNGKKTLYSKKEMNKNLGRGRSMDILDPCAMRMLPLLEFPYGDELEKTAYISEEREDKGGSGTFDIYDDSNWC